MNENFSICSTGKQALKSHLKKITIENFNSNWGIIHIWRNGIFQEFLYPSRLLRQNHINSQRNARLLIRNPSPSFALHNTWIFPKLCHISFLKKVLALIHHTLIIFCPHPSCNMTHAIISIIRNSLEIDFLQTEIP